MIISATFLKPRERRIREEARAEGYAKARKEYGEAIEEAREDGRAQAAEERLELERAAWQAWYQRCELAWEKGEKSPPPPFYR